MSIRASQDPEGFDRTQLDVFDIVRIGEVHRDYFAHCERWAYISNRIKRLAADGNKHTILDVGCGRDTPLFNCIAASKNRRVYEHYYGVDLNNCSVMKHLSQTCLLYTSPSPRD